MRSLLLLTLCWMGTTLIAEPAPTTKPSSGAKRVVVIIDGGGAMITKFDDVRVRASKVVVGLDETQSFNLLSSTKGKDGTIAFRQAPVPATADNKARLEDFLFRLAPHGEGDVADAMKLSLKMSPDRVHVFCAYDRESGPVMQLPRGVRVDVTVFGQDKTASKFLRALAKDSGGACVDASGNEVTETVAPPESAEAKKAKDNSGDKPVILKK